MAKGDKLGKKRPFDTLAFLTNFIGESSKVVEENSKLLKEVIIELKINNRILNEVHDLDVNEQDIK